MTKTLFLILSSLIVSALSNRVGSPKGTKPEDEPSFHQTGKFMVFGEFGGNTCDPAELKNYHGYTLGVCQPFVVPGYWWLNYAGTSSKGTFLMYQFFQDADCTAHASGQVVPGLPATGFEGWESGCTNRTIYSKNFNVQDNLPSLSGGTLIMQFPTEEACKANKIHLATGFMLAKKDKCVEILSPSMFVGGFSVPPGGEYGAYLTCTRKGIVSKVYTDPDTCEESTYNATFSFNRTTDFCVPSRSATGDILSYVNVKCV